MVKLGQISKPSVTMCDDSGSNIVMTTRAHSGVTSLETIRSWDTFCSTPEIIAERFLISIIMSFNAASMMATLKTDRNALNTRFNPIPSNPASNCIMISISSDTF